MSTKQVVQLKLNRAAFALLICFVNAAAALVEGLVLLYAPQAVTVLVVGFVQAVANGLVVYLSTEQAAAPGATPALFIRRLSTTPVNGPLGRYLSKLQLVLIVVFTVVEYAALNLWLAGSNINIPIVYQVALLVGLFIEHTIAIIAGDFPRRGAVVEQSV